MNAIKLCNLLEFYLGEIGLFEFTITRQSVWVLLLTERKNFFDIPFIFLVEKFLLQILLVESFT